MPPQTPTDRNTSGLGCLFAIVGAILGWFVFLLLVWSVVAVARDAWFG